jgi:hypothetical protein
MFLLVFLLCYIVGGCSTISVNHDFDPSADFTKYKSFDWIPQPDVKGKNPLVYKKIVTAVERHFANRGMNRTESAPDFLLAMHTGTQTKINVTDWGYTYVGRGWVGRDIDVYQYQEGTLILDVIDSGSKELVWRGSATGTIDPKADPATREANLQAAVDKLLKNFPPN